MKYVSFLFLFLVISACSKEAKDEPTNKIRSVACFQAQKYSIIPKVKVSGFTEPYKTAKLAFRISGVIAEKKFSLGDRVIESDVLASLEPEDFTLQLAQANESLALAKSELAKIKAQARAEEKAVARARVKATEKAYQLAKKLYESQAQLKRSKIISEIDLDKLKTEAEIKKEQAQIAKEDLALLIKGASAEDIELVNRKVGLAQVAVRIAEQNLKYLSLKAPFRGTITSSNIEKGEFSVTGKIALTIEDLYKIKLQASVPETQIAKIVVNQKAEVWINSLRQQPFIGRVSYISANSDPVSGTFTVEVLIENTDLFIRGKMFAWVEILVGKKKTSVLISPKCLLKDPSGYFVYSISQPDARAKVIRKDVVVGKLIKNQVEIISGIAENDWIISAGQHYITTGDIVHCIVSQNSEIR